MSKEIWRNLSRFVFRRPFAFHPAILRRVRISRGHKYAKSNQRTIKSHISNFLCCHLQLPVFAPLATDGRKHWETGKLDAATFSFPKFGFSPVRKVEWLFEMGRQWTRFSTRVSFFLRNLSDGIGYFLGITMRETEEGDEPFEFLASTAFFVSHADRIIRFKF